MVSSLLSDSLSGMCASSNLAISRQDLAATQGSCSITTVITGQPPSVYSHEGLDLHSWCSVPHWDPAGPQLTGKALNSSGLCRDICQPADTGGSRVPVITRPVVPSLSKHPTVGGRECGPGGQKAASWTERQVIRTDYRGLGFLLHKHSALGLFTQHKPDVMEHTCNPSFLKLEAAGPAVS